MKVLVFKSVDPSFERYAEIFNELGHESFLLTTKATIAEIESAIESFRPDFLLTNNTELINSQYNPQGEEIENYLRKKGIPFVLWEYEAPYFAGGPSLTTRWRTGQYPKDILYFNIDTHWVELYRKAGHPCYFLPFGADERLENFSPSKDLEASCSHDLLYVGTCFIDNKPRQVEPTPEGLLTFFLNHLRLDLLSTIHNAWGNNPTNVEPLQKFDEQIAPLFYEFFKLDLDDVNEFQQIMYGLCHQLYENYPQIFKSLPFLQIYLETRMVITCSYFQVSNRLSQLIEKGIRLFGEGGWNHLLPQYPHPVKRLSYPEMYAAFGYSKNTFCYTKKLFVNNVHERVLHVLALGGFPLTDHRGDIDNMFEAGEVATYRTFEEAKSLIDFYRTHESERSQIIERGRKKVFAKHTYKHRMQELIEVTAKHFGLSSKPHRAPILVTDSKWAEKITHEPKVEFSQH
jgi:spore maturation protein CgeB